MFRDKQSVIVQGQTISNCRGTKKKVLGDKHIVIVQVQTTVTVQGQTSINHPGTNHQ